MGFKKYLKSKCNIEYNEKKTNWTIKVCSYQEHNPDEHQLSIDMFVYFIKKGPE
jgi:hypothetical protein